MRLILILLVLLLYSIVEIFACNRKIKQTTTDTQAAEVWDYYVKYFKPSDWWGDDKIKGKNLTHFSMPKAIKIDYGRWLVNFVIEKSMSRPTPTAKPLTHKLWEVEAPLPVEGLHQHPPWAYVKGFGKPLYCFEHANYGDCNQNWSRWGYNTFTGECEKFKWSGCGGSHNNFVRLINCERSCKDPPATSCVYYGDYVEDSYKYGRYYWMDEYPDDP